MKRTSVSILTLTESCISKFNKLRITHTQSSQHIKPLESQLADFTTWADFNILVDFEIWAGGVGALAKPGASSDSRLQSRVNYLVSVKNVLIMLADSLDYYADIAEDRTNYDETDYHKAIQNVETAIENLALLCADVCRIGQASRNRRADQTFNPDHHKELRKHLECVILLRPTEEALFHQAENGEYVAKLDNCKLSAIQKRLIEANLRRRHRFLFAQKRPKIQKRVQLQSSPPAAPSSSNSLQKEPLVDIQNAADDRDPTLHPTTKDQASTISGLSIVSAAEGTLQHDLGEYTPSAAKTQTVKLAQSPSRLTVNSWHRYQMIRQLGPGI